MRRKYTIRPIIIPPGPSIAYIPLTQGQFALIDREDVPLVDKNCWCAQWQRTKGCFYVQARAKQKIVWLHRHLLSAPSRLHVDHKNSNTLDNRRQCGQIRLATPSQNNCNQRLRKDNTTGVSGVSYCPKTNRTNPYMAEIRANRQRIKLGYFPSLVTAAEAIREAVITHHGDFGRARL